MVACEHRQKPDNLLDDRWSLAKRSIIRILWVATVAQRDEIGTRDELAENLKISKSTLYKLAVDGRLPGQKIGKRWRFH